MGVISVQFDTDRWCTTEIAVAPKSSPGEHHNLMLYRAGVFPATARPFIGYFMVTWHLTIKLFPAKCHERATLRKIYDVKQETVHCYLRNVDCCCTWSEVAWCCRWYLSAFFKICFCFVLPRGTVNFVSLESFSGNEIHCSSRDQSLSVKWTILSQTLAITDITKIGQ